MKNKIWLIISLIVIGLTGCKKPDEPKPLDLPPEIKSLIKSDNEFGLDLFRKVLEYAEPGANVMVSPLSVSQALAMTYNGAAGDTKTAFEATLQMPDFSRDKINSYNKELVTALVSNDSNVLLEIANSIWYRQEYDILQDFIDRNQTYYQAVVYPVDFNDPGSLGIINGWVDDHTHHKIDKIIDQINSDSFMFLINAIYFKGTWRYEFDKKKTSDGPFYLEGGSTVTVPMMNQKIDLNMLQTDLFTSVELPYGKGNWSMFLFLPGGDHSLVELNGQLTTDNWSEWMQAYTPTKEVSISIPRFSFAFKQKLNNALIDMGLGIAFSGDADFSDMAPGLPLAISKVLHKTFIQVDEEGTEAAAVTSVEIRLTGAGNFFFVNRPFLFAIVEKSSGTILFIGQVMNPAVE